MGIEHLPRTIEFIGKGSGCYVRVVDQRALPESLEYLTMHTAEEMVRAIQSLALRGAPAIGVAGAEALVLYALNESLAVDSALLLRELQEVGKLVSSARPTAVNLAWGVACVLDEAARLEAMDCGLTELKQGLVAKIYKMEEEDERANRVLGLQGACLLPANARVLTHCNAGSLATVFFGTALGVIYAAAEAGGIAQVYVDETRPVGQGARLTAWELSRMGVPATLICDNMAASLMAKNQVDAVVVGADRICANGDTANKIGTYGLAVLAQYHNIPFYVCAPSSTVDKALVCGDEVIIEQRSASEVTSSEISGVRVYNPAFDVTPSCLITRVITEKGIFSPEEVAACI